MDDKHNRAANAPELATWEHQPYQGIERAPSPQQYQHHQQSIQQLHHPQGQPGLEPAPHSTLELSPYQISDNDKLPAYGPTSTTLSSNGTGASPYNNPAYVLPQPYGYSQETSTVAGSSAAGGIGDKEAGVLDGDGKEKNKRYCFGLGTKKQVAWSLLAIGIFLIVVGVAVGVGVGVSSSKGGDKKENR